MIRRNRKNSAGRYSKRYSSLKFPIGRFAAVSGLVTSALLIALPAMAHHPFGSMAPDSFYEGVVSGLGHPVIGLDHLAFVIALGLLAAVLRRGVMVPIAFLLSALVGTGLHLAELTLPAAELVISGSVLLSGALVASDRSEDSSKNNLVSRLSSPSVVILLAALAGLFHGYAYGEAVIGAEPTPLMAYLLGLTVVQGAIAYTACFLVKRSLSHNRSGGLALVRQSGLVICGAGGAFLGGLLV
ncbi:MAG: HupE/UreJ family protein [Phormidesmis sp.]